MRKNLGSEKGFLILALIIIFLYYVPYIFLGENAHILIDDNLDSNLTWVKILLDNNAVFKNPSTIIPSVFNGVPLAYVYPYYNFSLIIFLLFGIYWGYVLNKLIISIMGLLGMYFLLKNYFLPKNYTPFIMVFTSLIFSILPFWSFDASVLGIPLALFSLLNLRNGNFQYYNWFIILFFGFYSSFILSGVFLVILMGCILVFDLVSKAKINFVFILGICFLICVYTLSNYPAISGFFYDGLSHRTEFFNESLSFNKSFSLSWEVFRFGQYHAHSLHSYIFFFILLFFLIAGKVYKKAYFIFGFIFFTSIIYGFKDYHSIKPFFDFILSVIPIQLQRFHFLHPTFWYVLLAIALVSFSLKSKFGKVVSIFILFFQFIYVLSFHETRKNRDAPSFKDFYAESTFLKIKQIINKPLESFKVISIGIHPAIAQYNGFYTLDGYFASYSLEYKHQFGEIIKSELKRDLDLKKYFDNWGSRCYAFSSELGRDFMSNNRDSINELKYNFEVFKEMGGSYIISSALINQNLNQNLNLVGIVNTTGSYWKIYIYMVK